MRRIMIFGTGSVASSAAPDTLNKAEFILNVCYQLVGLAYISSTGGYRQAGDMDRLIARLRADGAPAPDPALYWLVAGPGAGPAQSKARLGVNAVLFEPIPDPLIIDTYRLHARDEITATSTAIIFDQTSSDYLSAMFDKTHICSICQLTGSEIQNGMHDGPLWGLQLSKSRKLLGNQTSHGFVVDFVCGECLEMAHTHGGITDGAARIYHESRDIPAYWQPGAEYTRSDAVIPLNEADKAERARNQEIMEDARRRQANAELAREDEAFAHQLQQYERGPTESRMRGRPDSLPRTRTFLADYERQHTNTSSQQAITPTNNESGAMPDSDIDEPVKYSKIKASRTLDLSVFRESVHQDNVRVDLSIVKYAILKNDLYAIVLLDSYGEDLVNTVDDRPSADWPYRPELLDFTPLQLAVEQNHADIVAYIVAQTNGEAVTFVNRRHNISPMDMAINALSPTSFTSMPDTRTARIQSYIKIIMILGGYSGVFTQAMYDVIEGHIVEITSGEASSVRRDLINLRISMEFRLLPNAPRMEPLDAIRSGLNYYDIVRDNNITNDSIATHINRPDVNGVTLLGWAINKNNIVAAIWLLQHGARMDVRTTLSPTSTSPEWLPPLEQAMRHRDESVGLIALLINNEEVVNPQPSVYLKLMVDKFRDANEHTWEYARIIENLYLRGHNDPDRSILNDIQMIIRNHPDRSDLLGWVTRIQDKYYPPTAFRFDILPANSQ